LRQNKAIQYFFQASILGSQPAKQHLKAIEYSEDKLIDFESLIDT